LVIALLASTLFAGLVTQEARAQTYSVEIEALQRTFVEFGLGRTLEMGQDILILGILTVMAPPPGFDTVQVAVFSPDPTVLTNTLDIAIPMSTPVGTEFLFAIQQLTLVPGDFSLVVASTLEGAIGPTLTYPVPNYSTGIGISSLAGEVGTQFLVTTAINIGNMSEIRTHFDIEYVLDGVPLRQSHYVLLFGAVQAIINEDLSFTRLVIPRSPDQQTWRTTQSFTLSPGTHSLIIRVIDQSINHVVATDTFSIQVTDQIGALETRLDELALELGDRIDTLSGQVDEATSRAANAELASATASSLAIVAFVALALGVVTLLIQFGILKLGRFGPRRPGEPQE
jgi:hypothetical protein